MPKVTTVGTDETEAKLASVALVAATEQVPALVVVRLDPLTAQPVAVPLVTVKLTPPVPEPPDVVSGNAVPNVPVTEVRLRAAWVALAKVTAVGDDDTGVWLASPALVAVTEQVPALVEVRLDPLTAQPVAVPLVVVKVTAPVPEPPEVMSVNDVPKVPESEVMVSALWPAGPKVTVVGDDEIAKKLASAALVAVTMQVPTPVVLRLDPLTAQPVAVPLVTENVTAPVPEPPAVVSANGVPKTPVIEVTLRAAWVA